MPPPAGVRARLTLSPLEDRVTPAAGDLDPRFGTGGITRLDNPAESFGRADPFTVGRLTGEAAALLSNGGVAIAGQAGYTYGEYVLDGRFRPTGIPDLTTAEDTRDFAVSLFNDKGGAITSFGTNGVARIPIDFIDDYVGDRATSIALQPADRPRADGDPDFANGRLVVGGVAGLPVLSGDFPDQGRFAVPSDFGPQTGARIAVLVRLDLSGALDASFDADGIRTFQFDNTPNGYSAGISDVAVYQSTDFGLDFNKIVAVSALQSNPNFPYTTQPRIGFQIARLNPDGSDDTTFGPDGNGRVLIDLGALARFSFADRPAQIVIQPDGKIVVAGCVAELGGDLVVARLDRNGFPDATFGTNGVVRVAIGVDPNLPTSVGGLEYTAAGSAGGEGLLVSGGDGKDFFVVRLTAGGQLAAGFGAGGVTRIAIDTADGNKIDKATGLGVEESGKIVVAGRANRFSDGRRANVDVFAAARLLPDGRPDPDFNRGLGRVYNEVGTGVGIGTAGSNDNVFVIRGRIFLAGNQNRGNGEFRDGRDHPDTVQLVAVQLLNDSFFNPSPPLPKLPPDPSGFPVYSRFAIGGVPGQVTAAAIGFDGRLNPPANDPLGVLPTIFNFDGVLRAASGGDVDGDGINDYAVVTGPGTPARFAVLSGSDFSTLLIPVTPVFGGSEDFAGGAFVSAGDLDGDGRAEVVFTPDRGGGPRVVVYSLPTTGGLAVRANFLGLADGNFRGGARSAVGDVNGDGRADLLVAAGIGGGPRVSLYDGRTALTTRTRLTSDFFVFDTSLRDGVFAAIGDVTGDGFGDLVFGAGDGGSPRLTVVSGQTLLTRGSRAAVAAPVANFFVGGDEAARSGVRVAVVDLDQDNRADVVAGSGPGVGARVQVYPGVSLSGGEPGNGQAFLPLDGAALADGVYVG